jgi:hypothetical protein
MQKKRNVRRISDACREYRMPHKWYVNRCWGAHNSACFISNLRVVMTPDGSAYAYSAFRQLSELYLAEGLK